MDLGLKTDLATPPPAEGNGGLGRATRKPPYIWGLDLIRFAAAVMTVFFHLSWKLKDPEIAFSAGWVGVEIFFAISGFVIMGSASGATVGTFARRRFSRLYPAAIGCAIINLAVLIPYSDLANRYGLVVGATPDRFIASMLLIKGPFLVGALWTLSIELAFYALIAALIARGWIGRPVWIAAMLIVWSGIYLVPFCLSKYGFLPVAIQSLGYGALNLTLLRHGCFFGVGILLWVTAASRDTDLGPECRHYALLLLGVALCGVEIVARVAELRALYGYPIDVGALTASSLTTFSAAIAGIWAFSRLNDLLRPGPAARSTMRYLGLLTYPLYLMHEGVGGVASSLLQTSGYGQGFALLAGLSLSIGASWLVVIALEPWLEPRLTAMLQRIIARLRLAARTVKSG